MYFCSIKFIDVFIKMIKLTNTKEFESLLANIQKCLKKYTIKELNDALVSFFSKKLDNSEEINFVLSEIYFQLVN